MTTRQFEGKRVLVIGLGRFGGGVGVTEWLVRQGAAVTVTDLADEQALASSIDQLRGLPITYHLGRHDDDDLNQCDLIVINPAVDKAKSPFFKKAVAAGIPWTTEMILFFERCPGRIIGVTGTAGKSTTCAALDAMLRAAKDRPNVDYRNVWLGGNIGRSLLSDLPNIAADDLVVLELSSFQLDDLGSLRRSPQIALITNLSDNHLDRHKTMDQYLDAKLNIFRFQRQDNFAFVSATDAALLDAVRAIVKGQNLVTFREVDDMLLIEGVKGSPVEFDAQLVFDAVQLPGRHNRQNIAAAVCIAQHIGLTSEQMADGVRNFKGLDHRLEFVTESDGVRYFNDSKSTTPAATMLALDAFDAPIVAIVGGSDKGASYEKLAPALRDRAKAIVCIGATSSAIADAVRDAQSHETPTQLVSPQLADTFDAGVALAQRLADPGDVVLLSPGHASYDMFANYEQRGQRFKELVTRSPE